MSFFDDWKEYRAEKKLLKAASLVFKSSGGASVAVVKAVDLERLYGFARSESNINQIIGKLPSGYVDFAQAYTHHPTMRACLMKRATSAADVIVRSMFFKHTDNPYTDIKKPVNNPFVKCFRYIKPNSGPVRFFEKTFQYLYLDGNAFWYFDPQKGEHPYYIHSLRPDRVTVATDDSGQVLGYVYKVGQSEIPLPLERTIHFKWFNPLSDHYGLGLAVSLAMTIESSFFMKNWNRKFFQNSARPDLILTTKESLSKASYERIKADWKKKHKGPSKQHEVAILEGGGDVKILNPTQKDLDFYKGIQVDADTIMGTTGVPPTILGFPQANYATAKESKVTFWLSTVLPDVNTIWDTFNASDIAYIEGTMGAPDVTKSIHLMDALMTRASGYQQLLSGIAKPNEIRTAIGLPPADGGDKLYIAAGFTPIEMSGMMYAGNAEPDPEPEPEKAFPLVEQKALPPVKKKDDKDERYEIRRARWKAFATNLDKEEVAFAKVIVPLFVKQRDRVLGKVASALSDYKPEKAMALKKSSDDDYNEMIDETIDIIFDLKNEIAEFKDTAVSDARLEIVREHGQNGIDEVGGGSVFDESDPYVLEYIDEKEVKFASEVNHTTREHLRIQLRDGIQSGDGITEIAQRFEGVFSGVDDVRAWRARTIARTEVVGAANKGQLEGWDQADVGARKEWVTSGDSDVRDEHDAVDGEVKDLRDPFSNGLMYPGDANGPAEEVVNCRCTTAPVI